VSRKVMPSSRWSERFARRIAFSLAIRGRRGPSRVRSFCSYFSESRYSSLPGRTGTFSRRSKPE